MVDYFADGMDAARYAGSRPNIHPKAIEGFRSFAGPERRFSLALDVGCGTGHSADALASIAERVIGIDSSADMLEYAASSLSLQCCVARAEAIPFRSGKFNLVAAGQAFHWFRHDAFLEESYRLLQAGGWLFVYTSWFTGQMRGQPGFREWFNGEYLSRYPTPPRDRSPLTEGLAHKHGLVLRRQEDFTNELGMTITRFTDYQLSTTNVIAAVRRGRESFEDAARWIRTSLRPFFAGKQQMTFLFSGKAWYVEKPAGPDRCWSA